MTFCQMLFLDQDNLVSFMEVRRSSFLINLTFNNSAELNDFLEFLA